MDMNFSQDLNYIFIPLVAVIIIVAVVCTYFSIKKYRSIPLELVEKKSLGKSILYFVGVILAAGVFSVLFVPFLKNGYTQICAGDSLTLLLIFGRFLARFGYMVPLVIYSFFTRKPKSLGKLVSIFVIIFIVYMGVGMYISSTIKIAPAGRICEDLIPTVETVIPNSDNTLSVNQ